MKAGGEELVLRISTIQVDFYPPRQFGISYVGEDGARHQPVIIHRAVLSTMERMVAHLIEHYGGATMRPSRATHLMAS